MNLRTAVGAAMTVTALCAGFTAQASAKPLAHGQFPKFQKHRTKANANQSTNWFGYNQGTLEQGGKQFNSITGDWTVPTASQHTKGQDAYSSDWIGIGGGCIDANCTVGDSTLIQTGTEQDVDTAGTPSYSAWWELIPGPSIDISNFPVSAGDHMHADISETVAGANVWKITLSDVTKGNTFTTTVPYASTHTTAEWIEETPLLIGTNAGLAPLPNLTKTPFSAATTNGQNAGLKSSEEIQLIDSNGKVIGTPSAPSATLNGFNVCAWATSCS
ncbi:MAG: G1 family glutamic endopeptidase [Thermoleophilaceae bacterium]